MTTWLLNSLFWVGVLFIPVGLALIIIPDKVLGIGNTMNKWISTSVFFEALDKSHGHEKFYYKYHRLLGSVIVLFSVISIYMLVFYSGISDTTAGLERLATSVFSAWLLQTCYFLLIALCVMALVSGIIILIRPSLLKSLESWGNRWIDTQAPLKKFDDVHDIPLDILPGKPRLFGIFVLLGAIYIVYITGSRIFL